MHPHPDPLAALLELSRRARQARSEAELAFLLVNDSVAVVPHRQAALWWAAGGVQALSGLVEPELNAPYCQWVAAVAQHCNRVADTAAGRRGLPLESRDAARAALFAFTAHELPADLAGAWADWWPAHALWVPLPPAPGPTAPGPATAPQGGLLLARDEPFAPDEQALWQDWAGTWWHALLALRHGAAGRRWRPWTRATAGALPRRRLGWRHPGAWAAAALAVAALLPVRLSVLAPGELVPRQPTVVRAPMDGVMDVFHVQPNQLVRKGQPLFGFDEAVIQSRLEVAQQALATATTELRQATQQALGDPRVRLQLALLNGRIEERRAEVGALRRQLERSRVLAPQDGVVLLDDPTEWIGRPVTVGERVLRIARTDDVEVEAWLPIADAIALQPGARVQLYLNASPLAPVQARLRLVAHEAVARPDGSHAYRVRATLESPTTHRVGLKGTAKLEGDRVPAIYWTLRRPLATLRAWLGV
jgi:multidrug efflux pump subunit AcrA (membrane-fusion protein)